MEELLLDAILDATHF